MNTSSKSKKGAATVPAGPLNLFWFVAMAAVIWSSFEFPWVWMVTLFGGVPALMGVALLILLWNLRSQVADPRWRWPLDPVVGALFWFPVFTTFDTLSICGGWDFERVPYLCPNPNPFGSMYSLEGVNLPLEFAVRKTVVVVIILGLSWLLGWWIRRWAQLDPKGQFVHTYRKAIAATWLAGTVVTGVMAALLYLRY